MSKLTKNLFSGDDAPEFGGADDGAQHVFTDEENVTTPVRARSPLEKLLAISQRTKGDPIPVLVPSQNQKIEDDLDVSPRSGD